MLKLILVRIGGWWFFRILHSDCWCILSCQKLHIRVTNDAAEWGVISRCFTAFIFSLLRDLLMADQRYALIESHDSHTPQTRHFVHILVTSFLATFPQHQLSSCTIILMLWPLLLLLTWLKISFSYMNFLLNWYMIYLCLKTCTCTHNN